MKLSTNRTIKRYSDNDEVVVAVAEIKETDKGHINMKLVIVDGNTPTGTYFYQTIGDPLGKGRYYLESFLDAVGVPEGMDVELPYFVGKRFMCVLGENEYNGKKNLTVKTYISANLEDEKDVAPFSFPDVTNDQNFDKPVAKKGGVKKADAESPVRVADYTKLFDGDDDE